MCMHRQALVPAPHHRSPTHFRPLPPTNSAPSALKVLALVAVPGIKAVGEAHAPSDQRDQALEGGGEERDALLALLVRYRRALLRLWARGGGRRAGRGEGRGKRHNGQR